MSDFDAGGASLVGLFGDTYGKTSAANSALNAELKNKEATSLMLRGQGLKSMFDVKRGEAMLPSDLAVANANADPELLKAQTEANTGKAKVDAAKYKMAIDQLPAEQITQMVKGNMTQQRALMANVVANIQAGANVEEAVNSTLASLPPPIKEKLLKDPAFLQQINVWTNETNPQAAVQILGNGIAGIDEKLQSFDPETWRTILKEQGADARNAADNLSREKVARIGTAAQVAGREDNMNTDKYLVQAAQRLFPGDIGKQQQYINEQKRAQNPASIPQTTTETLGVNGKNVVSTTKSRTSPALQQSSPTPTAIKPKGPQPGDVIGGYEFQGGNPADKSNWKPIK